MNGEKTRQDKTREKNEENVHQSESWDESKLESYLLKVVGR